jgi:hypothetical protein
MVLAAKNFLRAPTAGGTCADGRCQSGDARADYVLVRAVPRTRAVLLGLALFGAFLIAPGIASANTTTSDNWSGYAVHGKGAQFERVSASWRQPAGVCSGAATYSAFWVGLGGYRLTSDALEQIGTEFDCTASGGMRLSAWYELVPAPSRVIRMRIGPGDLIRATVSVHGNQVRFRLTDRTRHETFTRRVQDRMIDVSSAEWIAEAPSQCSSSKDCHTLPLADFGEVAFSGARAETTHRRSAAIKSRLWHTTKILLGRHRPRLVAAVSGIEDDATPTALARRGRAFSVLYTGAASAPGTTTSTTAAPSSSTAPAPTSSTAPDPTTSTVPDPTTSTAPDPTGS